MDFSDRGTGYLIDQENHQFLEAHAQPSNQFTFGDINPANLGEPIGMIDLLQMEDQAQMNSCAGNSGTTCGEACLIHAGVLNVQLSRMFCYTNGQKKCGIRGDSGCTLEGILKGLQDDGCPEEKYMPYTGRYYTDVPIDAKTHAKEYLLKSWSKIIELQEIYEGLARRVGAIFIGIPCTQDIFNADESGMLERYTPVNCGGHAMAIVDWCKEKDENGYPYLLLANSWGRRYGFRGYRKCRPSAVVSMMRSQQSTFYLLSDMGFIKPRYDWKSKKWHA